MSILDRYIAREFWKAFSGALAICVILFLAGDTVRQGFQQEVPAAYAFQYNLYRLPELVVMVLPAACLLATLVSLSGFGRRNEMIAMFASGISLGRIAFVQMSLVFILCCGSFIITDRIVPFLARERAHFYRTVIQKKPEVHTEIKQSKIWYRSKNLIYNLRAFDGQRNRIQGISIYFFDDAFRLIQQIEAQTADFDSGRWHLRDGLVTVFEGDPMFPLTQRFAKQELVLPETPDDFREIEKEVEQLRLKHLWRYIQRNREAGIDTHENEVTFWSKINMSLVPLVMALLGIPFATQNQRHSSVARDISICFLLIVVYWFIYSTALSVGKSGGMPPLVAAWVPNLAFFALGLFLVMRGKKV